MSGDAITIKPTATRVAMTREQARTLARARQAEPDISAFMEYVLKRIEESAQRGMLSLCHPFHGCPDSQPYPREAEAVCARLRELGYTVAPSHDQSPDRFLGLRISWD
jgi:hypothetical protein